MLVKGENSLEGGEKLQDHGESLSELIGDMQWRKVVSYIIKVYLY